MPRMPTTEKLAAALTELGDPRLEDIVERARDGVYDDFKTLLALPQHQLIADLLAVDKLEFLPFIARIVNGDFDAQDWEADEWFEREGRDILFSDDDIRRLLQ